MSSRANDLDSRSHVLYSAPEREQEFHRFPCSNHHQIARSRSLHEVLTQVKSAHPKEDLLIVTTGGDTQLEALVRAVVLAKKRSSGASCFDLSF
jgi:hypothetical protein